MADIKYITFFRNTKIQRYGHAALCAHKGEWNVTAKASGQSAHEVHRKDTGQQKEQNFILHLSFPNSLKESWSSVSGGGSVSLSFLSHR